MNLQPHLLLCVWKYDSNPLTAAWLPAVLPTFVCFLTFAKGFWHNFS